MWTLALLGNALLWTSNQSILHVCVIVYSCESVYSSFIICFVNVSTVGRHLVTPSLPCESFCGTDVGSTVSPFPPINRSVGNVHSQNEEVEVSHLDFQRWGTGSVQFILKRVESMMKKMHSLYKETDTDGLHLNFNVNEWCRKQSGLICLSLDVWQTVATWSITFELVNRNLLLYFLLTIHEF